jgi:uncharacterized surface protein with fasciclin (FAS1) repeats
LLVAVLATTIASCSSSSLDAGRTTSTTPAMPADVVRSVAYEPRLTTFATAVNVAGLSGVLQGEAPVTVFVPTNDAFAQMRPGRLAHLLKPGGKRALVTLLEGHVVRGRLAEVTSAGTARRTLGDSSIEIERSDASVFVVDRAGNRARVLDGPLRAENGVVYVVDRVLG